MTFHICPTVVFIPLLINERIVELVLQYEMMKVHRMWVIKEAYQRLVTLTRRCIVIPVCMKQT